MFVGDERESAVQKLLAAFDRVAAQQRPELVELESETGLGKTRIVQEFYARLARDRQGNPPYWPERLDTAVSGDVLRDRKRITPASPFTIAGNAPLNYVWWGILCGESEDGLPVPRLFDSARQFEAHAKHLAESRPDHVDTALTLVQDVIGLVGLANPVQLTVEALGVVKTSVSWMQRWRRNAGAEKTLAGDRHIDITSTSDEERCGRLADAVRRASNAGLTIVVVVDDAHHADPLLVSFLRQLAQIETGAVLVVSAAWPSVVRQRMDGTAGSFGSLLDSIAALFGDRFTRVRVDKLDRGDVADLLRDAAPLTSQAIVDSFCERIDGNPLLLRLYLDLDVIKRDIRDGALDTDPAVFGRLPSDAKGVWQELWRQLPEPARFALAVVSMQGPDFHTGFLTRAAADLQNFDAARTGLQDAEKTFGWIGSPTAEIASFTERLRYEVAQENQVQQLDPAQVAVVHRALANHAVEMKAGEEWADLPVATRRTILRSHIAVAHADQGAAPPAAAADSAFQLSLIEEGAGDNAAALSAARTAVEFAEQAGPDATEALVGCQTRLGLLERQAGNDAAAFEAINAAEVLSREVLGEENETTVALQEEVADLAIVVPEETRDEGPREWVGWTVRSVPDLFDQPLGDMAALIAEVARVEGPLTYGRLYKLLAHAADAARAGKVMQSQIDRAIAAGIRRRVLVSVTPYRGCDPADRIVASAGGSAIKVRARGDRTLDEVPFTELAKVAEHAILTGTPDKLAVKRAVMAAYDTKRLTERVETVMDHAIQIAQREIAKAKRADEGWETVHRAIAAIPTGRWTSIQDLAELTETSPGWVGRHLYGKWDLDGLHRVLEADGRPWRWFRWADGVDRGPVADVLSGEGVLADAQSFADPKLRLDSAELAALIAA